MISVIIPVYHATTLPATLVALTRQREPGLLREIIVAGEQPAFDLPAMPCLEFIPVADRPSPAHNRNVAAQHARADWLCFTDADCVPSRDWLARWPGPLRRACPSWPALWTCRPL